jgi:hypothetical protein
MTGYKGIRCCRCGKQGVIVGNKIFSKDSIEDDMKRPLESNWDVINIGDETGSKKVLYWCNDSRCRNFFRTNHQQIILQLLNEEEAPLINI